MSLAEFCTTFGDFGNLMATYTFERWTDPKDACHGSSANGNCPFKKIPETNYCPRHGGNKTTNNDENQATRLYLLGKWQQQVGNFVDSPKAKTLGEEIGIVRMLIQNRLQQCLDQKDLIIAQSSLSDLTGKVNDLVKSWHKIEKERSLLLDADRARQLASGILDVITRYINDNEILQFIAEDIGNEFNKLNQ